MDPNICDICSLAIREIDKYTNSDASCRHQYHVDCLYEYMNNLDNVDDAAINIKHPKTIVCPVCSANLCTEMISDAYNNRRNNQNIDDKYDDSENFSLLSGVSIPDTNWKISLHYGDWVYPMKRQFRMITVKSPDNKKCQEIQLYKSKVLFTARSICSNIDKHRRIANFQFNISENKIVYHNLRNIAKYVNLINNRPTEYIGYNYDNALTLVCSFSQGSKISRWNKITNTRTLSCLSELIDSVECEILFEIIVVPKNSTGSLFYLMIQQLVYQSAAVARRTIPGPASEPLLTIPLYSPSHTELENMFTIKPLEPADADVDADANED